MTEVKRRGSLAVHLNPEMGRPAARRGAREVFADLVGYLQFLSSVGELIEATPWGGHPRYLIHDRDAVYGGDIDRRLANLGIAGVRTPTRAPRANSIAERVVRSIRTEVLDHVIIINERHLHAVLTEYINYYNVDRPYRSLNLQSPVPRAPTRDGPVVRRPVLGGLHHVYARAA